MVGFSYARLLEKHILRGLPLALHLHYLARPGRELDGECLPIEEALLWFGFLGPTKRRR